MSRIVSLIAAALTLAACANPTAPDREAAAKAAKASLTRAAKPPHALGRLAVN